MTKPLIKSVAATIRKFRISKNISQEELAYISGLDRTYISGVERGVRNITLNSLEQIIQALDIPNSIFLEAVAEDIRDELQNKQAC